MPGITNPDEEFFKDGTWGWDGLRWHKLSLLWGISAAWMETVTDTAEGAGDAVATTVAVDGSCVHVLQGMSVYHTGVAAVDVYVVFNNGPEYLTLARDLTLASGIDLLWFGELALVEGTEIVATATSPGAGKIVAMSVWGYKMLIAE